MSNCVVSDTPVPSLELRFLPGSWWLDGLLEYLFYFTRFSKATKMTPGKVL